MKATIIRFLKMYAPVLIAKWRARQAAKRRPR